MIRFLIIYEPASLTRLQQPKKMLSSKEGFERWGCAFGGDDVELNRSRGAFSLVKKRDGVGSSHPPSSSPDLAPRADRAGQGRVNHLCPRTKQACQSRPSGSEILSVVLSAGLLPPVLDLGLLTLDLYVPPPQQPHWTPAPTPPIPQGLPNSPSDSASLADVRSSGE